MASSNKKQEQEAKSPSEAPPPGERRRDDERESHGPVYHGGDWSKADHEEEREALERPAEEEARDETERADEELDDPGTRGAVFGKGGKGIVQRDGDPSTGGKR